MYNADDRFTPLVNSKRPVRILIEKSCGIPNLLNMLAIRVMHPEFWKIAKITENKTTISETKGFNILSIDCPPKFLELDVPPKFIKGGK